MHNGQIAGYEQLKRQLDYQIPQKLYSHRLGSTDSELLFMLLIKFGLESDTQKALLRTIDFICDEMVKIKIVEPFQIYCSMYKCN